MEIGHDADFSTLSVTCYCDSFDVEARSGMTSLSLSLSLSRSLWWQVLISAAAVNFLSR
jgi:hypothetical protein